MLFYTRIRRRNLQNKPGSNVRTFLKNKLKWPNWIFHSWWRKKWDFLNKQCMVKIELNKRSELPNCFLNARFIFNKGCTSKTILLLAFETFYKTLKILYKNISMFLKKIEDCHWKLSSSFHNKVVFYLFVEFSIPVLSWSPLDSFYFSYFLSSFNRYNILITLMFVYSW